MACKITDLCYESHYAALKFLVGTICMYFYVFQLQISFHAGLHGHSLPANSLDWFGLLLCSCNGSSSVGNQLGEPMVAIVLQSRAW